MLKRYKGKTALRAWGLKLAKTKCHAKATVAVARELVVIMHAMWRDGSEYTEALGAAPSGDGRRRTAEPRTAAAKDRKLLGAYA